MGATGNTGRHFLGYALEQGYDVRVLVRNKAKLTQPEHSRITVIEGNSTNLENVKTLLDGADVVVSCLGNPYPNKNKIKIMEKSYDSILNVAREAEKSPRCLMLTSLGCGGSAPFIKVVLSLIGGFDLFNDYVLADKRVCDEEEVSCVLVRPSALNNKDATGEYRVLDKRKANFVKPISRKDLAKFLLECVENTAYDNKKGVILCGK